MTLDKSDMQWKETERDARRAVTEAEKWAEAEEDARNLEESLKLVSEWRAVRRAVESRPSSVSGGVARAGE
jgi:hypothetical protein